MQGMSLFWPSRRHLFRRERHYSPAVLVAFGLALMGLVGIVVALASGIASI